MAGVGTCQVVAGVCGGWGAWFARSSGALTDTLPSPPFLVWRCQAWVGC